MEPLATLNSTEETAAALKPSEPKQDWQVRDGYLAALVQIQRELLKQQDVAGSLERVLAQLGEVSGASRVYYLEHEQHDAAAPPGIELRAGWSDADESLHAEETARWQLVTKQLRPATEEKLRNGETDFVILEPLPPLPEHALSDAGGARAALFVPIVAGKRFYGALGFERCASAQAWLPLEIDHLKDAAGALALALERESHARALADEQERMAVTLASVTEAVITTDLRGQVVLMNRVAEELTGWTIAEALGRPVWEVFVAFESNSHVSSQPLADSVAQVLATGRAARRNQPVWLYSRNGTAIHVARSNAPVYNARGQVIGAVCVFRDISEQEKIAEELLKASKLESIGILAGGIAHDFNNILTAVIGNLSLAKTYNASNERATAKLDAAERACFRARDLTNQLLTFAKGGAPVKKLARLEETVRDSVTFALHGSPVQCCFFIAANLWPVEADTTQLSQVLNNLAINAVQAMPKGGVIKVRAENLSLDDEHDLPSLEPGNYVKISIEDDGEGIATEHAQKIFDPFFSTRKNGAGLGLATSYSIIKKHGGHIGVDSVRGVGSTFRIYLPSGVQPSAPVAKAPPEDPPSSGSGGRVLMMDDEPSVRELAQAMLSHLDFQVTATVDGAAAVRAFQEARDAGRPFDAVILDLTVPGGMGGAEAFGLMRQIDPTVKAIVSSGYSNNPIMSHYQEHGFSGVLGKPYRLDELAALLARLLGKDEGAEKGSRT
jgi:two-component system cell cycle sensor histidine kinase/response regulator CckA